MLIRDNCHIIGFDNCKNLIRICKNKDLSILLSNIKYLPYRSNLFDGIFLCSSYSSFRKYR